MSLREVIKMFPHYRIFKSLIHPRRHYAILETDVEKMEIIKKEFSNKDHFIPDSLKVRALPLDIGDNDFHNVFDHHPTRHSINDLVEEVLSQEDAKIF
jgi:hypothetical protein